MGNYEQAVFISYAWGEDTSEREIIVNELDQSLQKRGIKIVRDKRDLGYKGSIRDFMSRIGEGNCVIIVISDKYLRSKNCMFELVEVAGNKQFGDRIFPIILKDAKIYDWRGQAEYLEYWEKEKAELDERIKNMKSRSNLQGLYEELDDYERFRAEISKITNMLEDMNSLSPDMLREADFQQLYDAIVKRMSPPINKALPSEKNPEQFIREYFEPETILVPEGIFWLGSDTDTPAFDIHRQEVSLPEYRIGKYPVKNFQYQEFVRQTGRPVSPVLGWSGRIAPDEIADAPVMGVTLKDAQDYCEWLSETLKNKYAVLRKYELPNEAQLERAYKGNFGCDDIVDNIYLWTCALWGEKSSPPDPRYHRDPWMDDIRNNSTASSSIRRVVCQYQKVDGTPRKISRTGQRPSDPTSLPGARHSFRVVMKG